jgi:DnaJ like chaperone protein
MIRWVTALVGYMFFRIPGALLGFLLGMLFDQMSGSQRFQVRGINPKQFELNLLALAAVVIKADGIVDDKELKFVRNYFISQYGPERAKSIFKHFNAAVKQSAQQVGSLTQYFVSQVRYETRLQILHFLFAIANADGKISPAEVQKIEQIALGLNLRQPDVDSIKAMFFKSSDNAYKILELSREATDAEVKQAYRQMAKKYHPDRLQTQDEALKKGAQEKFQQVQQAYEMIKKERQF